MQTCDLIEVKEHPMTVRPLSILGVFLFSLSVASTLRGELIEVGVARVDITPDYPVRLHGYLARSTESVGVAQKIWAKALAIGSDQQVRAVLVSVDNLGVSFEIVKEVEKRLERKAKLNPGGFVVASSHTHSAPCLTGVAPNIFGKKLSDREQAAIDRYTRELTDKLEQVALDALKARRPGLLSWAQGRVDFAANRRTPGGPVDHALPVLRVTDPDGTLRALVVNYACHCTTLDPKENRISGDWAGYAQETIERDHPGAIALTVIGCGADANPTRRLAPGAAEAHGRAIADEVNRLLRADWTPLPPPNEVSRVGITLPFDTLPTREELEKLAKAGGAPGYNASVQLARLDRGEPLQSTLDYPIAAWRFGDRLAMVFLAGEVVVDYVLRLKQELDPTRLWVTAYANDVPCYIPSERILREGGYEGGGAMVYYDRPTRLKPGIEDRIIETIRGSLPGTFRARSQTNGNPEMPPPKTPDEALGAFRLKPGLRVELVVAEPLIESPVAIDFGAEGKLWVCEMRDYPTGIDGNWKPGGVIKYLEDSDGDGRYEKATIFLEGLPFPTGVMAWRKGVLVCAAPEILYAEDTDGDGKADVRRVLFHGFATENYQARVNGLSYGLDNWVYGANGLIGGMIRGLATGREINIGGRDFRIHPDTGVMEPASGLTQQGRMHDDWGNQFGGNNSVLIQHYPFPDHYARRNPRVAVPAVSVYVPRDPESTRLFPASRTLERFNQPQYANRVTSACGPAIYRDRLLGDEYAGNAFICEPVHNLVHREVLAPDGVTFAGHRARDEQDSEFLASTDNWFRPVQVRTGPDGALWVVDMYRFVIEHPRWISPELLARLDVRAGADKGRIYRILPEKTSPRPVPNLEAMTTPALAGAIDHPNGTFRDNVQRLLVHRGDRSAVPTLRSLIRTGSRPESRTQALGALDGLGALTPDLLQVALADPHPGVRRQAIRLSEPWLGKDQALERSLEELVQDPDLGVGFQLALSLGETDEPGAGTALGRLAVAHSTDPWIRAAVLSSSNRQPESILNFVVHSRAGKPARSALAEALIATIVARQEPAEMVRTLDDLRASIFLRSRTREEEIEDEAWRFAGLAVLLEEVERAGKPKPPLDMVLPFFRAARALASDHDASTSRRVVAVRLLGFVSDDFDEDLTLLGNLLDPTVPAEVQRATIARLGRLGDDRAARSFIVHWKGLGPGQRAAALDALLARPAGTRVLLAALEGGVIPPTGIDATHRQRLANLTDETLRARAVKLFTSSSKSRQAIIDAYRPASAQPGDPDRGKLVFGKICAACHKLGGQGHEVGPDLAALTDTSAEAFLTAILDPNREVDARYASYTAALKDGRVVTGLVASETGNAISLKRQEGQTDVILRADLDELTTSGQSLMPEGLENDLKPTDLADLLAYLTTGASRPKSVAGNRPELVRQDGQGILRLAASSAAIFGPTLTFEPEHSNLGYWQSADDHAAWTFEVSQPGTFTVSMEWACADESAGNTFLVRSPGQTLSGTVGGTGAGTWSRYRTIFLGELTFKPGVHRLEFRPDGPVRGALLDLRAVVLTPRSGMNHGR
jgi:putative membrane-bound dehydrogenase-like protein